MATKVQPAPLARPLYEIAAEIRRDYRRQGKSVYFAAVPYVAAMTGLTDLHSSYGYDSAEEVVIRLLGNLGSWRGETATRVKGELRAALADHKAKKGARR